MSCQLGCKNTHFKLPSIIIYTVRNIFFYEKEHLILPLSQDDVMWSVVNCQCRSSSPLKTIWPY